MSIDVKEAVSRAKEVARDLFKGEDGVNPTLEEVRFDDDQKVWRVTIGIRHRFVDEVRNPLTMESRQRRLVDYRVIELDAENGAFRTMTFHESAA